MAINMSAISAVMYHLRNFSGRLRNIVHHLRNIVHHLRTLLSAFLLSAKDIEGRCKSL